MFFVGAVCQFDGVEKVQEAKVKTLEKLGRSKGRALRFMNEHTALQTPDGTVWRPLVFILPDNTRLANDEIQAAARRFSCDWQLAKFHCYRAKAYDWLVKPTDWPELLPKKQEQEPTSDGSEPISETAACTTT